ncbi:MAG: PucR family transcriptional regulator [Pseudonocardia sp.]
MHVSLPVGQDINTELRELLSNVQGLLMLSMLMTESADQAKILALASTSVPSLSRARLVGVFLRDEGWQSSVTPRPRADVRCALERQLGALARGGGALHLPDEAWAWALPLRGFTGHVGYLVVAAADEPTQSEHFLMQVLAQQAVVALVNARLHARERSTAEELRRAYGVQAETLRALEHTMRIHDRFTQVAAAGEGQCGIARALNEVTGYSVAIEDRYGNLRAWAGPARPNPYPKETPAQRELMLRRAVRKGRPIREGDRLIAIASPSADVLGVLALVDPAGTAGERDKVALEHGATVLSMELARLRSVAETELRVRRDLVEELLSGTDEASALARAQALGHDLERPHRVVVVEGSGHVPNENAFFHSVRRVALAQNIGVMLVARGGGIVILSDAEFDGERFRTAILADVGGGRCRVGVGGWCDGPGGIPRSYREAQLALKMLVLARDDDRTSFYDDLGVYQLLGEVPDLAAVERFVRRWLGPLLDYDARRNSELVPTLSKYLECGGSWDGAAAALCVHRSTLKYRLQRIREISGHHLADPRTSFNLHLATQAWQTVQSLRG